MTAKYDRLGVNYDAVRRTDDRIAAALHAALGDARTVLNVGAGTGSYEPTACVVTALEPSTEMIRQRPVSQTRVVQGYAEELPFADDSFDASMAVLTVHHWRDKGRGLAEMRRVTRGPIVILTFDPSFRGAWLTDYIPELIDLDATQMPSLADYSKWLGPVAISPVLIPHDCSDGFQYAYWRRPEAYGTPEQLGPACERPGSASSSSPSLAVFQFNTPAARLLDLTNPVALSATGRIVQGSHTSTHASDQACRRSRPFGVPTMGCVD